MAEQLDFGKALHTVSELQKYSLGVTALAVRGHRELKIICKE